MCWLAIYLIVGAFVAGAISIQAQPKNALSVPMTIAAWPLYVAIRAIRDLTE